MNLPVRIKNKSFDYWERHGFKPGFQPNIVFLTINDYKELLIWCEDSDYYQKKKWINGLNILSINSEVTSVGRFKDYS